MHYNQLEYILEVAKTGSIFNASQNLHVSPATISLSISNIEKKFGIKIFKRSRRGTEPTDAGEKFIEKAYEIREKFIELESEIQLQTLSFDKKIRIVSTPSSPLLFLPKALEIYRKNHPYTEFSIKENSSIIKTIANNEADIGFIAADESIWNKLGNMYKSDLHFETTLQGKLYVCASKNSSLFFKDTVTPEEIIKHTFALYTVINPIYENIMKQYGFIKVLMESSNVELIKSLILEGRTITILLDLSIRNDPLILKGDIAAIPLVNYEKANLTYGFVCSKRSLSSPTISTFLRTLRATMAEESR